MNNISRSFRMVSIITLALTAVVPSLSHAGWLADKNPAKKVVSIAKSAPGKAVSAATKAPAAIQAQVEDILAKLNDIHAQVDESRPLVNAMKDGKIINDLQEIMTFLNDTRQDYEQFANSGVQAFSQDVSGLLYDVGDIGEIMQLGNDMDASLAKAQNLISKMPPQFMYLMHEAFGPTIINLREQLLQLTARIEFVRGLPSSYELMSAPEQHQVSLCPIVNDKNTQVSYQVVKARIAMLAINLDFVNEITPDDLNISVTVVGGGGTTVSKFPAKYVTQALKSLADRMGQRLENIHDIAEAVCE